jgi:aryl-alcohol dehydrogenase
MKVTAAVVRKPGRPFSIERLELDDPRADEVLIRIVGTGICHTDIAVRDQHLPAPMPVVLGHEGSGIVEKVGSKVSGLRPGDHVVLSYDSCGRCPSCEKGLPGYCPDFFSMNFRCTRSDDSVALHSKHEDIFSHFFGQSSFASFAITHQRNTIKVRNDAPLELLGPLGCGVQTGAGSVMRALRCEAGSSLVIAGGGSVGLSAVLGAVVQGCHPIIVVEPHEKRRELALSLGATHVIDPVAEKELTSALNRIAPTGLDYALDTSSLQSVISSLLAALTFQGSLLLVGVPRPENAMLSLDVFTLLSKGITVKGITEGDADPREFIPVMIDLFMDNQFPFDKLCKIYPLEEINIAIEDQHNGLCVKPILRPS